MEIINQIICQARIAAQSESVGEAESKHRLGAEWPIDCQIGPGLEGAIACDTKIGYVNGAKGALIYRGYDIFDLCEKATFEEVCYLLLHGDLPSAEQLETLKAKLSRYRSVNSTLCVLMGFPVKEMGAMAALRLGTNMLRREIVPDDDRSFEHKRQYIIGSDEDSIAMENAPTGNKDAAYSFLPEKSEAKENAAFGIEACYHLIAGLSTITAAVSRLHRGLLPIEPHPELGHAANFLYMMNGVKPSPEEARIMDVALILHADHGMNASTFASMVVASTMSDFYFSVGSGIAALNGPLHGGANEQVIKALKEAIAHGDPKSWVSDRLSKGEKIPGFGHRVYKTYDPRSRVLAPLAKHLVASHPKATELFRVAQEIEGEVVCKLGSKKQIFPNVDYYSGIVYSTLGINPEMFTPIFAVSRVAGWVARMLEYSENNRIFRPRARYVGEFEKKFVEIEDR